MPAFAEQLRRLGDLTGEDTGSYSGYLAALRNRRAFFATLGATSTDHGHPTAQTADLSEREAEALFRRVIAPELLGGRMPNCSARTCSPSWPACPSRMDW